MPASKKIKKVGTYAQVKNGTAEKTSGGLTSGKIIKNSKGKWVSAKRSALAKKRFAANPALQAKFKANQGILLSGGKLTKASSKAAIAAAPAPRKSARRSASGRRRSVSKRRSVSRRRSARRCASKSFKQCRKASKKCKYGRRSNGRAPGCRSRKSRK